jgi:hypothetical protein
MGSLLYMFRTALHRVIELVLVGMTAFCLVPLCIWIWWAGDSAYLGDAGMRILWQLIQGGLAGIVLLVGCILVFRRRGGVVLRRCRQRLRRRNRRGRRHRRPNLVSGLRR